MNELQSLREDLEEAVENLREMRIRLLDLHTNLGEIEEYTEGEYRDYLDESHELIDVCGREYLAGRVLQIVDPIAFRVGYADRYNEIMEERESETREDISDLESACLHAESHITELTEEIDILIDAFN